MQPGVNHRQPSPQVWRVRSLQDEGAGFAGWPDSATLRETFEQPRERVARAINVHPGIEFFMGSFRERATGLTWAAARGGVWLPTGRVALNQEVGVYMVNSAMVRRPQHLPFLEALAWQRHDIAHLSPEQELSLYERNWRLLGIIAQPSKEELDYIRELARRHGSDLACEL